MQITMNSDGTPIQPQQQGRSVMVPIVDNPAFVGAPQQSGAANAVAGQVTVPDPRGYASPVANPNARQMTATVPDLPLGSIPRARTSQEITALAQKNYKEPGNALSAFGQGWTNAAAVAAQDDRERQDLTDKQVEAERIKAKQVDYLRQNAPTYADAVEAGIMDPQTAFSQFKKDRAGGEKEFTKLDDGSYGYWDKTAGTFTKLGSAPKADDGNWDQLDDGRIINKKTGEIRQPDPNTGNGQPAPFRFNVKSIEGQALNGLMDSGKLTPDQAQQLAAGKQVTGPNGEILFMTPEGIFSKPAQSASPAAPASAAPPVAPTDGQAPVAPPSTAPPAAPADGQVPTVGAVPSSETQPNAIPAPQQGAIQLTGPKAENNQLPAEMGARIGLGDAFLTGLPDIRKSIQNGELNDAGDRTKFATGSGRPAEIWRKIESGRDALVRNLTGAGMPESEAQNQAARYQISAIDSPETMLSKLNGLENDLIAVRQGAIGARTGDLVNKPAPVAHPTTGGLTTKSNQQGETPAAGNVTKSGVPWSLDQ